MRSKLTGDWEKIKLKIANLQEFLIEATIEIVEEIAWDFLFYLREVVEGQAIDLAPLSPDYAKRKTTEKLDNRILIATGEYLSKLDVKVDLSTNTVYAGAPEDVIHEASGQLMTDIYQWLEFGTINMPARPHFTPAWDQFWYRTQHKIIRMLQKRLDDYWR